MGDDQILARVWEIFIIVAVKIAKMIDWMQKRRKLTLPMSGFNKNRLINAINGLSFLPGGSYNRAMNLHLSRYNSGGRK